MMPMAMTTVPVSMASFTTDYTAVNQILPQSRSNVVISEVFSDKEDDNDSSAEMSIPRSLNRRNSMSTTAMAANREMISRKVSNESHSTDSPSLPKRNQPVTSSAPSTLTKSKTEQKTGEVYV